MPDIGQDENLDHAHPFSFRYCHECYKPGRGYCDHRGVRYTGGYRLGRAPWEYSRWIIDGVHVRWADGPHPYPSYLLLPWDAWERAAHTVYRHEFHGPDPLNDGDETWFTLDKLGAIGSSVERWEGMGRTWMDWAAIPRHSFVLYVPKTRKDGSTYVGKLRITKDSPECCCWSPRCQGCRCGLRRQRPLPPHSFTGPPDDAVEKVRQEFDAVVVGV